MCKINYQVKNYYDYVHYRQVLSIVTGFDKKHENNNVNNSESNTINKYNVFSEAMVNELESIIVKTNTASDTRIGIKRTIATVNGLTNRIGSSGSSGSSSQQDTHEEGEEKNADLSK